MGPNSNFTCSLITYLWKLTFPVNTNLKKEYLTLKLFFLAQESKIRIFEAEIYFAWYKNPKEILGDDILHSRLGMT